MTAIKKKHTIKLTVGDWSHDGHGMSNSYNIECNLSSKQVETAYNKASKTLGFDFITLFDEYECCSLEGKFARKLLDSGFKDPEFQKSYNDDPKDTSYSVYSDVYVKIYMWIAKLSNGTLEYKFVDSKNELQIGGYGLFSS